MHIPLVELLFQSAQGRSFADARLEQVAHAVALNNGELQPGRLLLDAQLAIFRRIQKRHTPLALLGEQDRFPLQTGQIGNL